MGTPMFKQALIVSTIFMVSACTAAGPTDTAANVDTSRMQQLEMSAPLAKTQDFTAEYHGKTLSDPYNWLKDQGYPEIDDQPVLDYLNKENDYYYTFLEPHKDLVEKIFQEFKGRTDETETSVPYVDNGYEYRWYFEEGAEYRIRARKNLETGEEQIYLNETALAEGHKYFVIGGIDISPDNNVMAYSVDTSGDERYEIKFVDLRTGKALPDTLTDASGGVMFSSDGSKVMYSELEKDRWHTKYIKIHSLGTEQSADRIIYHEKDNGFFPGFGKTSSDEFILIGSTQGEISETHYLPADFAGEPKLLVSRKAGFSHEVDHAHGKFYILANDTHKNFRLAKVSDKDPAQDNWETLIKGSDNSYLMGLQTFDGFLALKSRDGGFEKIHIRDYDGGSQEVTFPEEIFAVGIGTNPEFDQSHLRLNYESMVTPDTVFDYDIAGKSFDTRKVQKIPSGYDKTQYETKRVMAPARDGKEIPISLVYKKGLKQDGNQPLHLYGYGAYSSTVTPRFSTLRLSELDRGFVYAIAHVRGGSMMGYNWYLDGKLEKRPNTFNDFVDAAEYLIDKNYVAKGNISISGRSAGGELMGAAVIQAPDLWRSVNLGVPFVDVLNTMLDETLPLTPPEWKEWGNPIKDPKAYDLLQSYSPYDNITARDYPPMFVSGGLNDPRVTYWEPAKWTAKMRATKTDENLLVMRMNMGAGHFSNSGRYGRLKDFAEETAFMFLAHGITE